MIIVLGVLLVWMLAIASGYVGWKRLGPSHWIRIDPAMPTPYHTRFASIIVEPRAHMHLETVLRNVHETTPIEWPIYVVHGLTNGDMVRECVARSVGTRRAVFYIRLHASNLGPNQYNRLFLTERFWDTVAADHVLVFQTDVAICRPITPDAVLTMQKYGYLGCQTSSNTARPAWGGEMARHVFGGVGGMSFRNVSFMKRCIQSMSPKDRATIPEDVAFSACQASMRPVPPQTLASFCWQGDWSSGMKTPTPLGVHKPSLMNASSKSKMTRHCPAVSHLLT